MKKVIVIISLILLFFLLLLSSSATYLYFHQEKLKPLVEKLISSTLGIQCKIKKASLSFRPIKLKAEDITFKLGKGNKQSTITISRINSKAKLTGPFGNKRIKIENLTIHGIKGDIKDIYAIKGIFKKKRLTPSSFLKRLIKPLIGFFFFKEIEFISCDLEDIWLQIKYNGLQVEIKEDRISVSKNSDLRFSLRIRLKRPEEKLKLLIPEAHIFLNMPFKLIKKDIIEGSISGKGELNTSRASCNINKFTSSFLYNINEKKILISSLKTLLSDLNSNFIYIKELALSLNSEFKMEDEVIELKNINITAPEILNIIGRGEFNLKDKKAIIEINDSKLEAENLIKCIKIVPYQRIKFFKISNSINLKGKFILKQNQRAPDTYFDVNIRLLKNPIEVALGKNKLNAHMSGDIQINGSFPELHIKTKLKTKGKAKIEPLQGIHLFNMTLKAMGTYPNLTLDSVKIDFPYLRISKSFKFKDVALNATKSKINIKDHIFEFPEVSIYSKRLKHINISADIREKKKHLKVTCKDSMLIENLILSKLKLSLKDVSYSELVTFEVKKSPKTPWMILSHIRINKAVFSDKEEKYMGDGLSIEIDTSLLLNNFKTDIPMKSTIKIDKGELLLDRFYLNAEQNPIKVSSSMRINNKELFINRLDFVLKELLSFNVHGSIAGLKFPNLLYKLRLKLPKTSLKNIYNKLIKDAFGIEHSSLKEININGNLEAKLGLNKINNRLTINGRVKIKDGIIEHTGYGIKIKGLNINFPVIYRKAFSDLDRLKETGSLRIDSISSAWFPEQSMEIEFEANPELIITQRGFDFRMPGGDIQFGRIRLLRPYSGSTRVETSLKIKDYNISYLLKSIYKDLKEATLNGSLNKIVFEKDSVKCSGKLYAHLFGGDIIISDIGILNITSGYPRLSLNAKWNNILLEELTRNTQFGKITGVLRGYIKNFQLSGLQPERFDLLLESVKRKGVSQKISVKAVNNISKIGGGGGLTSGVAGIFGSFFKELSYEKIGIHATLENDMFTINGTIKEDGKEYLVKRGPFFGVNIINQNPNNRIGFKEMIKRIKSIKKGPSTIR